MDETVENINIMLVLAFIFFIGSTIGWGIEVIYRRFFSDTNPERKWINPGFLQGPYLPLYGFSLVVLYLLAGIPMDFIEKVWLRKLVLFIFMSLVITAVEYVAGLIFIKKMNILLWDYSNDWMNIQGIICPKYTFYWMLLGAAYYFLVHGKVIGSIYWLTAHPTFSFFVGVFYGIFFVDLFISLKVVVKIRDFARENQILVRYEEIKYKLGRKSESLKLRANFMFPFISAPRLMGETLKEYLINAKNKVSEGVGVISGGVGTAIKTVIPVKKENESSIMADIKRMESEE